jgi:hypothetical protein
MKLTALTCAICITLTACSTSTRAGDDAYWQDPHWTKTLFDALQSSVHAPSDDPHLPAPNLHATIKFTFQDGIVEYPEIIQGTGDVEMDNLMLRQLAAAQAPKPIGPRADEPHEFVLVLQMLTPMGSFQDSICAAIDYARVYPKEALLEGARGITTVAFDYLDGKASNISVVHSSNDHYLDKASLGAVSKASLPLPPSVYAGKTLHMEMVFCYSLNGSNCPAVSNLISVHGTLR